METPNPSNIGEGVSTPLSIQVLERRLRETTDDQERAAIVRQLAAIRKEQR